MHIYALGLTEGFKAQYGLISCEGLRVVVISDSSKENI